MPLAISINKAKFNKSPFEKSLFGRRAHAPRRPRLRHRAASGVVGWRPRPPTPSALARPLRPPRDTSNRQGAT
eukprot:scaffold18122_cov68-Phaeocystis_antarctica.AAC.2